MSQVVVLPASGRVARSLRAAGFAERFDAVVLALHPRGAALGGRLEDIPIRAGDVLVVEGSDAALQGIAGRPGFVVAGVPMHPDVRPRKPGVALLTLAAAVTVAANGPGGYRFRDFVRMGIPLDLLLAAIALTLIPRYWPLTRP